MGQNPDGRRLSYQKVPDCTMTDWNRPNFEEPRPQRLHALFQLLLTLEVISLLLFLRL